MRWPWGLVGRATAETECSCECLESAFSGSLDTWSHGHFCGSLHKSFEQWTVCHSVINLSMFSVWLSREGLFYYYYS